MLAHPDDLQGVGAAGAANRFTNRQGNQITLLDDAAVDQELLGFGQQEVAIGVLLQIRCTAWTRPA